MAKKLQSSETKQSFEQRLSRLEELGDEMRKIDIPLDDAIKAFEEGIKLARSIECDLEKIETRIEILMSGSETPAGANEAKNTNEESSPPELELFTTED